MSTPDPADIFRIEAAELLEQMEQGYPSGRGRLPGSMHAG